MFNIKILKMKNLENYGVLDMNANEIKETEGGFWGAVAAGVTVYLAVSTMEYPGKFVDGLLGREI